MLKRFARRLVNKATGSDVPQFPSLQRELPLPDGMSEQQLFDFVTAVRVADAPEAEMVAYGTHDFRRFVYTWGLTRGLSGRCLELGANPYFTTTLLKQFTGLELELANYFGNIPNGLHQQAVNYSHPVDGSNDSVELAYRHFNVEEDRFPYDDDSFDAVIFAEIIEHLLHDPCRVLREIRRVLKPEGCLILTTPNVARLENVARIIAGANIYDPYSGYGPYGRHNREYNVHELTQLLAHEGLEVEQWFTSDVHPNQAGQYSSPGKLAPLLEKRVSDLGQYIFIRASKTSAATASKLPAWLYRSYSPDQLD